MKLHNINQVHDFLNIVNSCEGTVWLESAEGDKFVLNSELSRFVALGALLEHRGSDLELFCSSREDEAKFLEFFYEHPGTV